MNLTGNTILITGGATGIGLAMAEMFLAKGNRVAVCGRRQKKLDEASRLLPALKTVCCDVSSAEQRQQLLGSLLAEDFSPNVLINNAAVMRKYNLADTQSVDLVLIEQDVAINLLAPIALIQLFLPVLRKQANPVIMNVTSPGGVVPLSNVSIYCASKAAINSYTKSLRHQLNGEVEVIEMYPPSVDTDMMDGVELPCVSVAEFIRMLFRCLQKGGNEIWVGEGKYLKWIHRIAPGFAYNLVNKTANTRGK